MVVGVSVEHEKGDCKQKSQHILPFFRFFPTLRSLCQAAAYNLRRREPLRREACPVSRNLVLCNGEKLSGHSLRPFPRKEGSQVQIVPFVAAARSCLRPRQVSRSPRTGHPIP